MALYINPATGKLATTKISWYVQFNWWSTSNGVYTDSSWNKFNSSWAIWREVSKQPVQKNNTTWNSTVTLYYKDWQTMNVPSFDVSYWWGQWWNTTKPSASGTSKPVWSNTQKQTSEDKNIYKKWEKLYYKDSSWQYVYIPDSKTLQDLIYNKWYKDSRKELPEDISTAEMTTQEDKTNEEETDTQSIQDKKLDDFINNYPDIDESQRIILRQLAAQESKSWTKFYQEEDIKKLLADVTKSVTEDISPYYEKISSQEVEDLKNKMSDLRGQAERYDTSSTADYKATLAETKQSLRQRWLTFSGIQRKELWKEWAISSAWVEWAIPEERRLDYAENQATITQAARDAWLEAERKLWSSRISWLSWELWSVRDPYANGTDYNASSTKKIYKPTGTTSIGDYDLNKKRDIAREKWSRLNSLNQYLQ